MLRIANRALYACGFLFALGACAPRAHAQRVSTFGNRNLYGAGVGVLSTGDSRMAMLQFQVLSTSGHFVLPAADLAAMIHQSAIEIVADMGFGLSQELGGRLLVLARAGPSFASLLTTNGAAFQPGYHVGGGLLLYTGADAAVRVDVTREYLRSGEADPLWRFAFTISELGERWSEPPPVTGSCGCRP